MSNYVMTQAGEIAKHLKDHGSITSDEAVRLYGINNLCGVINKLVRKKFKIVKKKKYANKRNYVLYSLKKAPHSPSFRKVKPTERHKRFSMPICSHCGGAVSLYHTNGNHAHTLCASGSMNELVGGAQ